MEFLAPWSLAGLALVPAIFLWGLLAPRGRPITVGSLMLWRRALGAGPAGRPSARVRLRDPLLWLDALAILALVLACARPALEGTAPAEPAATVVVDRTASLSIESAGGARWGRALALAQDVLAQAGDVPVRLVSVPGTNGPYDAEMVGRQVSAALAARGPVPAAGDVWPVALAEAARQSDRPVLVVTDLAPAAAVPANVHVLAPGGTTANVGLTRVSTRIEDGRWWLLVAARAAQAAKGEVALNVTDGAGRTLYEGAAGLAAGATVEQVLPMPGPPPAELHVRLAGPTDGFAADNDAYLVLATARQVRVRLVGKPDPALRRALAAQDNVTIIEAAGTSETDTAEADVVVACRALPPDGWAGPVAIVLPPAAVGPVQPGQGEVAAQWRVEPTHPLARAFYLEPPRVGRVQPYILSGGAQVLVGTRAAPLLATWEDGGRRRLAVLFDYTDAACDWTRRAGFPVFWTRAMDWLVPAARGESMHRTRLPVDAGPAVEAAGWPAPGFYGKVGQRVGVSFLGTEEGFQAGSGQDDSTAAVEAIRAAAESVRCELFREVWPYLAGLALVLLAARAWVAR